MSGCLAALEGEALARESGVDLVVGNGDKDRLVEIALAALEIPSMPELAITDSASALFTRGRQRAFVKVQDGCRYQCTFCITTQARGAERSRPAGEVIAAIDRLQRNGIDEVVLAGVHLGGYGHDQGSDLVALIRRMLCETQIARIRLGSLEPWDLPESFWSLFENPRLMPHLHLPLQSGSDAVLKRMARRCQSGEFARLVAAGRAAVPDLNVTTDIIVGFPGEGDDDWRRTLEFVETMRFGHVHIFSYSPRAGTRAAELSGRVETATKKARCSALRDLASRLRLAVMREQIGKRVSLLYEGGQIIDAGSARAGYTPNYLPVHLAGAQSLAPNQLLTVELSGLDEHNAMLLGESVGKAS